MRADALDGSADRGPRPRSEPLAGLETIQNAVPKHARHEPAIVLAIVFLATLFLPESTRAWLPCRTDY